MRRNVQRGMDTLAKIWRGPKQAASASNLKEEIQNILSAKFPSAKSIEVEDITGGHGAIFQIYIEDSNFKGLPIVKQHQEETNVLKDQIKLIHGIRIVTKVPRE